MSRDATPFVDSHGRPVNYLRLSVTDRCNLRCFYCRSKQTEFIPHPNILRYEEMLRLARLARNMGVNKVRLTGGEPFARRGFLDFLGMLAADCGDMDIRITTNATFLRGKAERLRKIGVTKLNISIDSLDPAKYEKITGVNALSLVLEAIDECLAAGLSLKLNAVALKGLNDDELPAFLELARTRPIAMRFIEFMPIGDTTKWDRDYQWPAKDILAEARKYAELEPVPHSESDGPARNFLIRGGEGRFGLISPMSNHFCHSCNRLRITSDGRLRPCLFSDREIPLRALLRDPDVSDAEVERTIREALADKPIGYELLKARNSTNVCHRVMSSIGG